jgi:hypothetical protein
MTRSQVAVVAVAAVAAVAWLNLPDFVFDALIARYGRDGTR